jgi:hypothetical protein
MGVNFAVILRKGHIAYWWLSEQDPEEEVIGG